MTKIYDPVNNDQDSIYRFKGGERIRIGKEIFQAVDTLYATNCIGCELIDQRPYVCDRIRCNDVKFRKLQEQVPEEDEPRYQLCRVCSSKDCDCTMEDLVKKLEKERDDALAKLKAVTKSGQKALRDILDIAQI